MIFPNKLDRLRLQEGRGEIDLVLGCHDGGTPQTRATIVDRTMKQITTCLDELRNTVNQALHQETAGIPISTRNSLVPTTVDEMNHSHIMTLQSRLCRRRSLLGR